MCPCQVPSGTGTLGRVQWPLATGAQRPRRSQFRCILLPRRHVSISRWRRARCGHRRHRGRLGREREAHGKDARRAPRASEAGGRPLAVARALQWPVAQPGTPRTEADDGPMEMKSMALQRWTSDWWMDGHAYGRTPTRPCSVPLSHRATAEIGHARPAAAPAHTRSNLHPYRDRRNANLKSSCRPAVAFFFFWSRLLYGHKYGFSWSFLCSWWLFSLSAGSSGLASSAVAYTYNLSSVITRLDVQASTNSHVHFKSSTASLRGSIRWSWSLQIFDDDVALAPTCTAARRRQPE